MLDGPKQAWGAKPAFAALSKPDEHPSPTATQPRPVPSPIPTLRPSPVPILPPPSTPKPTPAPSAVLPTAGAVPATGPAPDAVFAPVPAQIGDKIYAFFNGSPQSSQWKILDSAARLLTAMDQGSASSQSWDTTGTAPGIYFIAIRVVYKDGRQGFIAKKVALIPPGSQASPYNFSSRRP